MANHREGCRNGKGRGGMHTTAKELYEAQNRVFTTGDGKGVHTSAVDANRHITFDATQSGINSCIQNLQERMGEYLTTDISMPAAIIMDEIWQTGGAHNKSLANNDWKEC